MAGLTLSLLGAPSLRLSPGTSSRGLGTSKGLALLAYLALEAGPHTREELAALLWGDSPETAARASLRQTLKRLRTLVADALHVDRDTVELRGAVQCDVEAFLQAAEHEPERAADYPVDRFFSGVSLRHAPAFEDWRMRKRQALMQRWREAVRCLTRDALARSHWREAAAWADRWMQCDPLSEEAARCTIESRFLMGDRGAALACYDEYRERLRREIGTDPSVDLQTVVRRVEAAVAARPDEAPAEPLAPTFEAALVGREGQWRALQDAWAALGRGLGRVVLIEGEAGLGKTRLAEDFLQWARVQGATVLRGRAYHPSTGMPFGPVIEALRGVLDAPGLAGTDPEWLAEAARLLPELRRRFPALPEPAPASAGERWRLFEAIVQMLQALAAERPLLLCIDDVQWCDGETSALLHCVCRRIERAPIGIVLCLTPEALARDAPTARLCRVLRAQAHGVSVRLDPLTEEEVWRLIREMGRIRAPAGGRGLAHRLQEATDGNPFHVIELIKTLFTQGLLTLDPGTAEWRGPAGAPEEYADVITLPASVRDAFGERIDSLPYDLRDLLATAALAGRAVHADLLSHVHGMSRLRVAALADPLVERRLLVEEHGLYRCAHTVIAEVLRERLTPARRHEVHRAIALSLATLVEPATAAELAGAIAWHAERGGERHVAYRHALVASDAAVVRCAFEEAASWLDLAAGVAEPGAEADEVNRRTARVLELAGWSEPPPAAARGSAGKRIGPKDMDLDEKS